jgi:predicted tellurium resistance membrane protein TerC
MIVELFGWMATPHGWAALLTLAAMEIVLGIDNVVFISVLTTRLPDELRKRARQIGLGMALVFRVALLFTLTWIIGLTEPVVTLFGQGISWRDVILIVGGLFLIVKATHEIHAEVEGKDEEAAPGTAVPNLFLGIVAQIAVVDLVFSLDSIITAIGMVDEIGVMIAAVMIAIAVMYWASEPVGAFIAEHPTTKVLALAFLILIGMALVADGTGFHVPKGYIYSALAFSALVEFVNVWAKKKRVKREAGAEAEAE